VVIEADQYADKRRNNCFSLTLYLGIGRLRDLTAWGKPSPIRSRKGWAISAITASHTLPCGFQAPHRPLGRSSPRVLEKACDETRLLPGRVLEGVLESALDAPQLIWSGNLCARQSFCRRPHVIQ